MRDLWSKDQEKRFFSEALKLAGLEQLFYLSADGRYYAYWPKGYVGTKSTLQSRNALIGSFTEKWSADLIRDFVEDKGFHAIQGAVCDEISLSKRSSADIAVCKTKDIYQVPENIVMVFEIKMSIVWNWEYRDGELICIDDYRNHQGNPGLLRSDSMLKAIGKCINIRVSSQRASNIPLVVLGNTPITESYYEKVDLLKKNGVIQGFWSVNPKPLDGKESIAKTKGLGFCRFDTYDDFAEKLEGLFENRREYFSSMKTKNELGRIIEIADREITHREKAEKFLGLIRR